MLYPKKIIVWKKENKDNIIVKKAISVSKCSDRIQRGFFFPVTRNSFKYAYFV